MQTSGAGQAQRGHVLLIAGDTAIRRRAVQVEPSANLAALSMVPVSALLASNVPADTTYLDGVKDQQALLMKLRTAAATPGPLLVYLSGRLTLARRDHQLYLALAHTTASTIRYTALPWEWLGTELRHRPAGLTTVLVDLAADKHAWPHLQEPGALATPPAAEVYGVIAPPGYAGSNGVSTYTRGFVEQLRLTPDRPTNAWLHALTVGSVALPPGALVLPHTPEISAPQTEPGHPRTHPPLLADDQRQMDPSEVTPGTDRRPDPPAHVSPFLFRTSPPQPAAPGPAPAPQSPLPQHAPPFVLAQPAAPAPPEPRPANDDVDHRRQRAEPAADPVQGPGPGRAAARTPVPQPPVPVIRQSAARPQNAAPDPQTDPRPYIHALAEQHRYSEATQLAQLWEQHALTTYGVTSAQATQWTEIRADLAKMQGNWVLATQLWIAAGRTRLAHQSPDAPQVMAAVKSAHYCWTQISDPRQARECGPELISLLRSLPMLDHRHLSVARQRLEFLHNN
ncbi:hypothetical protein [Streptomyces sp. NPDC052042]|uniref:hypothetical protein n=1 Tax=Streptomyces sp. NPDC052042 TaxID=3365683 RepID=UPI0037D3BEBA